MYVIVYLFDWFFFITRKWKKGLKNGETTRYHGNIILQYTYEYLTVDTSASHVYLFAAKTFLISKLKSKSVIVWKMTEVEKPPKANIYRNPSLCGFDGRERHSSIISLWYWKWQ